MSVQRRARTKIDYKVHANHPAGPLTKTSFWYLDLSRLITDSARCIVGLRATGIPIEKGCAKATGYDLESL